MVDFLKSDNIKEVSFDRHSLSCGTNLGNKTDEKMSSEALFGAYVEFCIKEGIVSFAYLELTKEQINDGGGSIKADKTIPFDLTEEFAEFFRGYASEHHLDNKKAFNHLVMDISSKKLTIPDFFRKLIALSSNKTNLNFDDQPENNRICLIAVGLASYAIKHLGMRVHNKSIRTLVTLFPNEYKNSDKEDGCYVFGSEDGNTLTEHNGPLTLIGFPLKEIDVKKLRPAAVKATPVKKEEPKVEKKEVPHKEPKPAPKKNRDEVISDTKEKEKVFNDGKHSLNVSVAPTHADSGVKKNNSGEEKVTSKITETDVDAMMDAPVEKKKKTITYYHDQELPSSTPTRNPVEESQRRVQSRFDDPMDFVNQNAPAQPELKDEPATVDHSSDDWSDDDIEQVAKDNLEAVDQDISEEEDRIDTDEDSPSDDDVGQDNVEGGDEDDDDGEPEPAFDQTYRRSNGVDSPGIGSGEKASIIKNIVGELQTRTGDHKARLFVQNPTDLPKTPTRRFTPTRTNDTRRPYNRPAKGSGYQRIGQQYASNVPNGVDYADGNVHAMLYIRYLDTPHFVTGMRPIIITNQYIKVREIYKNSRESRGYGMQYHVDSEPAGDMVIINRMVDNGALEVMEKAGHSMKGLLSEYSIELLGELRDKVTEAGFDFDFSKAKLEMVVSMQSILKFNARRYTSEIKGYLIQIAGTSRGFL